MRRELVGTLELGEGARVVTVVEQAKPAAEAIPGLGLCIRSLVGVGRGGNEEQAEREREPERDQQSA